MQITTREIDKADVSPRDYCTVRTTHRNVKQTSGTADVRNGGRCVILWSKNKIIVV